MAKNAAGKSTSQRISDEIYATPLVQPQKIVRKVTKKAAKPAKKSVRFSLFCMCLSKIHRVFFSIHSRREFMNYKTKCTRHPPENKDFFFIEMTNQN